MSGLSYWVIDTETNGIKSAYHEMTEIGIIRAENRVQLWKKIKCDYPERSSFDALKITGKTLADLSIGETKENIVKVSNEFFSQDGLTPAHRCIVGHNIPFDRRFLHALWAEMGQAFPAHLWLDTISLTKEFLKKADHSKLNITKTATGKVSTALHAACDLAGIKKLADAHNARVDSRNTYLLWRALIDQHGIDYLPHIKTQIHSITTQKSVDELLAELEDN